MEIDVKCKPCLDRMCSLRYMWLKLLNAMEIHNLVFYRQYSSELSFVVVIVEVYIFSMKHKHILNLFVTKRPQ